MTPLLGFANSLECLQDSGRAFRLPAYRKRLSSGAAREKERTGQGVWEGAHRPPRTFPCSPHLKAFWAHTLEIFVDAPSGRHNGLIRTQCPALLPSPKDGLGDQRPSGSLAGVTSLEQKMLPSPRKSEEF